MAYNPSMPFSYSGPSVAATFTTGFLNDAIALTAQKDAEADDKFDDASRKVAELGTPYLLDPTRTAVAKAGTTASKDVQPVRIDLEPLLTKQGSYDGVLDTRYDILNTLVTEVEGFFDEFFPGVNDAVENARRDLEAMLAGANFADGVQRGRIRFDMEQDKLRRDLTESETDLMAKFAARGFRRPPGALVYEMGQMQRKMMYDLADSSMSIDEEESRREAQNLERMLRLLVNTRNQAIAAFSSYLAAACTDRYDEAMAKTKRMHDAEMLLSDQFYAHISGVNKVAASRLKQIEADSRLSKQYLDHANRFAADAVEESVKALAKQAQSLATIAATAFNQLRAGTGIGARESF